MAPARELSRSACHQVRGLVPAQLGAEGSQGKPLGRVVELGCRAEAGAAVAGEHGEVRRAAIDLDVDSIGHTSANVGNADGIGGPTTARYRGAPGDSTG